MHGYASQETNAAKYGLRYFNGVVGLSTTVTNDAEGLCDPRVRLEKLIKSVLSANPAAAASSVF